jgi:flagellar protein FliS
MLVYIEDAITAKTKGDMHEFERNLESARNCIGDLRKSLDFEYELSRSLFSIYTYSDRQLANDIYNGTANNLDVVADMMKKLRKAFYDLSLTDDSQPMMENTQEIYAGLTYGKTDINETLVNPEASRGFTV